MLNSQIPPRNMQMYVGARRHTDVWGHADIQGASKHIVVLFTKWTLAAQTVNQTV